VYGSRVYDVRPRRSANAVGAEKRALLRRSKRGPHRAFLRSRQRGRTITRIPHPPNSKVCCLDIALVTNDGFIFELDRDTYRVRSSIINSTVLCRVVKRHFRDSGAQLIFAGDDNIISE